jgi:hypothetical protein
MTLRKRPKRLMSEECAATSLLGKQFVQKPEGPLPKETWRLRGRAGEEWALKKLKVCLKI